MKSIDMTTKDIKVKKMNTLSYPEKVSEMYFYLKEDNILGVLLHYFKTTIIHVGFEAVITVLFATPLLVFSNSERIQQSVSLPILFSKVLLNGALVFSIVVFMYLISLFAYILLTIIRIKKTREYISKHIKRVSIIGIIVGIITYFAGGIIVAYHPELFTGMKSTLLSPSEKFMITIIITALGLIWAIQSRMRYKRVEAIINETIRDPVYVRVKSVIVLAFIICIVAFLLLYAFRKIPVSSGMFDYYNLMLAIYFGIYSAYFTICYKFEIQGVYPNELEEKTDAKEKEHE